MVGTAGNAPASPRCHRGGLLLTYAPWSGSAELHRAFPVPQTGGTLPCPEPGRSPSGQPRVAYPRFAFRLVVVAASACHLPERSTGPKPRPLRGRSVEYWGGRRDSHSLKTAGHSRGARLFAFDHHMVRPVRIALTLSRLSSERFTFKPRAHGAGGGLRTRDLLVGNEPSYSSTTPAKDWLGRRESDPHPRVQGPVSCH